MNHFPEVRKFLTSGTSGTLRKDITYLMSIRIGVKAGTGFTLQIEHFSEQIELFTNQIDIFTVKYDHEPQVSQSRATCGLP